MDRAAAQRQDWGMQAPSTGHELNGLVRGLSELNPALAQYAQSDQQLQAATVEKERVGIAALAQQQSDALDMQGKSAMEFAGNPTPSQVPLALAPYYRDAFNKALGEREGIRAKDQGLQAYMEAKDKPDFNVNGFLSQYRTETLQGLEGVPVLAAQVGNQVNAFEVQVRQDAQRQALLKHTETRNATVAQSFADALRPDLTPSDLFTTYTAQLLPRAEALGMSKKEGAQFLLQQLTRVSDKMGGNPAVFDIFDSKDAEGLSLGARNPELLGAVQTARSQAQARANGKLMEDSQERNFLTMAALDKQMKEDPASITLDVIRANMGKAAPFATHDEAFAFWNKAQKAAEDKQGTTALQRFYDNRTMWLLPPDDQKKVMEANLGPYALKMAEAVAKGDKPAVTALAENIMRAQSAVGAKVPLEALAQFINTTVTSMPGKAPSPAFEAAASIYRAYSSDPAFREIYFKGDVAEVMQAYIDGSIGGNPEQAYLEAYRTVSPEARERASKIVETSEFKDRASKLYKEVAGSSMWPKLMGGNSRPADQGLIGISAAAATKQWLAKNPNAGDARAMEFAQDWVSKNFVLDTTTQAAVKIPPEYQGRATQEALSVWSQRFQEEFRSRMSEADAEDWHVTFLPEGDNGTYLAKMQKGAAFGNVVKRVTLQEMLSENSFSKGTTTEEKIAIRKVKLDLENGTADPAYVRANSHALMLGKRLGVIKGNEAIRLSSMVAEEMFKQIRAVPMLGMGPVDSSALQFIPQRGARIDNKLTAQVASSFMTQAVQSPAGLSSSLAGSLITMAEGMALQAYPDPAKDAGNNLGMGYNLKANMQTAQDDLKRSGVPEDRISEVLAGQYQLTQDQARRLLMVTMPRYEEKAKKGAEHVQKGLWEQMSPNQKAVMTDIAYSVGSTDQFTKAWRAVADGNAEAFKAAVMTTYVNKAGERVQDVRRFNLRAAMLSGTPQWNAMVAKYAGFPSNQLDSLSLK